MATAKKAAAKKTTPRAKVEAAGKSSTRRRVIVENEQAASSYFTNIDERTDLSFVNSGCAVLNAALSGGWVLGRVANIVGDKSAGKTLLAIEACANFHRQYPKDRIRYAEAEAAFDEKYAAALGVPVDAVDFNDKEKPIVTVEDFHDDLVEFLAQCKGRRGLYILDSLDALSDEAEQARDITDSSYGGNKAKKMGEMFRRLVQRIEETQVLVIVISQLRDKLNVTFGEKQTRAGGRALDFYASHIVWLAELGKIKRTIAKVERVTGVDIKARVKKNKVGLPYRECEYPILFGYGVDDLTANVKWLCDVGADARLEEVGLSKAGYKISLPHLRDKGGAEVQELRTALDKIVWEEWQRIEKGFLPRSRKY